MDLIVLFFILYLLAGVCFGLAAGRVKNRVDFLALGLLLFVLVPLIQTAQKL